MGVNLYVFNLFNKVLQTDSCCWNNPRKKTNVCTYSEEKNHDKSARNRIRKTWLINIQLKLRADDKIKSKEKLAAWEFASCRDVKWHVAMEEKHKRDGPCLDYYCKHFVINEGNQLRGQASELRTKEWLIVHFDFIWISFILRMGDLL